MWKWHINGSHIMFTDILSTMSTNRNLQGQFVHISPAKGCCMLTTCVSGLIPETKTAWSGVFSQMYIWFPQTLLHLFLWSPARNNLQDFVLFATLSVYIVTYKPVFDPAADHMAVANFCNHGVYCKIFLKSEELWSRLIHCWLFLNGRGVVPHNLS